MVQKTPTNAENSTQGIRGVGLGCGPDIHGEPQSESDVEILHEACPLLDELEAQLRPFSHQIIDETRCFLGFLMFFFGVTFGNHHAQQDPRFWVHCGFFQLVRRHFAQAFESANFNLFSGKLPGHQCILMRVVAGIDAVLALRDAVKRRAGEE